MNDQQRQRLVEQYEEAALSLWMHDYANEEGARLAKEFDEAQENGTLPEIPAYLDEKCIALIDKSFAKMERKARLKRIGQAAVKAAVILFIVLGVMTTTVMSVDALRIPLVNYLIKVSETYSSISEGNSDTALLHNSKIEEILEVLLPDDYQMAICDYLDDGSWCICFQSKDADIVVYSTFIYSEENKIDTENAVVSEVIISDTIAYLIEKDGYRLVWIDEAENMVHDIYANNLEMGLFWDIIDAVFGECKIRR